MRVELIPAGLSVVPGKPAKVTVRVTNTSTVISGHECRVLGLDPAWVRVDQQQISLFPDTSGDFVVTVVLPLGLPAGTRTLEIEVTELTPPNAVSRSRFNVTVPEEPDVSVSLDPVSIQGGSKAHVGILVENTGNAPIELDLAGNDEEGQITFQFLPDRPTLEPGEQIIARGNLRAKRPWFGSPKVRPYTIEAGPAKAPVIAHGAWVQHPRLTRGNMSLIGLAVAATVFAIVLSAALSSVVGQSNADRDLALQVAEAGKGTVAGGSSSVSGVVQQLSSNVPLAGVTVDVYPSSNTGTPLASTATNAAGAYSFSGLAAGSYKLSYVGAGFIELWYPGALAATNAGVVTVKKAQAMTGVDIHLGGEPATISGTVVGPSTAGAVLSLELPPAGSPSSYVVPVIAGNSGGASGGGGGTAAAGSGSAAGGSASSSGSSSSSGGSSSSSSSGNTGASSASSGSGNTGASSASSGSGNTGAVTTALRVESPRSQVRAVDTSGPSGTTGSATTSGNSGSGGSTTTTATATTTTVAPSTTTTTSAAGAATTTTTLPATQSTTTPATGGVAAIVTTQTLTAAGTFSLANVPSPAIYDLVVTEPGYAPATQEIDLGGGENRTGIVIQLHKGDGSIAGTVSSPTGPIGGATISATNGSSTVNTITATTAGSIGTFSLASLPTPSTLTLTVSAPGYASQTISVTLAAAQQVTGIAVTLLPGVGSISGTVTTPAGLPVGGVTVTASNGSLTLTTTTLSLGKPGSYILTGLPVPGSYTVTFSRPDLASQTQQVEIPATGASSVGDVDVAMLAVTASVKGVVSDASGTGVSEVAVSLVSGAHTYNVTTAATPTAGAYEIDGVSPGTYNLSFTRPGGVPTSVIITLTAGQVLTENETLSPAASIYGFVANQANGEMVPGAQVNLYLSSQYPAVVTATTTTNSSGEFVFSNVDAPQSFLVAVSYPSGSSPQETVLITTSLGLASPACGSNATGAPATTTTTLPAPSSSSGASGATGTTTTTTTTTTLPTTTTTVPNSTGTCNPQSSPLEVTIS